MSFLGLPRQSTTGREAQSQECIASQLQRDDADMGGVVSSEAAREGSAPGPSSWFADGHLLPVSPHHLPPLCVCLCPISPLYKDSDQVE